MTIHLSKDDYQKGSLRADLSEVLKQYFSSIEVNRILLAVEEAVVNIFEHGYQSDEGTVDLKLFCQDGKIRIELRDRAPVFDSTARPLRDPAEVADTGAEGGYGLYLMRTIMNVSHKARENGNLLILERTIPEKSSRGQD